MILSASRRTDIPTFYGDWFMNRIREGFVLVRNPMNYHQVSKIDLSPAVVDCIVFWTKNPYPFLKHLSVLDSLGYSYYFQYTLNSYGRDIEPNLPSLEEKIRTFQTLSKIIGPEKVVWRYDPILLSDQIDMNYHFTAFEKIARCLSGYSKECVISFLDLYPNTQRSLQKAGAKRITSPEMMLLAHGISAIAELYDFTVSSCSEEIDLSSSGIQHASCIDRSKIETVIGSSIQVRKDRNQRKECGCVESIDIGVYNTCRHGCLYCYANSDTDSVKKNCENHQPNSPMLIGNLEPDDTLTKRKVKSVKESQMSLF